MRPVKKKAKLILKDGSGSLYQLLPEVQTAVPEQDSSLPVSSGGAYTAISQKQAEASSITAVKVTEDKPTSSNASSLPNKSVIVWLNPEGWVFEVNTEAAGSGMKKSAVPFNLYGQDASITVYWGDGTASTLSASDYEEGNSTASVHEYAQAGRYEITVECAEWESADLLGIGSNEKLVSVTDSDAALYWWRRTLTAVQTPIPPLNGTVRLASSSSQSLYEEVSNFRFAFCDCTALEHICEDLFSNQKGIDAADSMFEGCTNLLEIPEVLFAEMDIESFNSCFRGCSKLSYIPASLFADSESAADFSRCFQGCSRLFNIPSKLFDSNLLAEDFSWCFQGCGWLFSIPSRLFRLNEAAETFQGCFSGCSYLGNARIEIGSSLVSSFESFFITKADVERIVCVKEGTTSETSANASASSCGYTVSTDSTLCYQTFEFTIDTEATVKGAKRTAVPFNLASTDASVELIIDWGDDYSITLKKENFTISDSRNAIHEYASPGKYCVRVMCSDWSAVCIHSIYTSYIQDIAINESNLNNGNADLYYFRNTLVSIDAPLPGIKGTQAYDSPTETGTLYTYTNYLIYTFGLCTHLKTVPEDLFWKIPNMSGLMGCFGGCYSLQEIPEGLLSKSRPSRVDFLFGECKSLTEIPEDLFKYNTTTANFTQCFSGCEGLLSIPEDLFKTTAAASSLYAVFHGCIKLTSVPAGLFSSCPNAQRFDYAFDTCPALKSVPVSLFAACTGVLSFARTFRASGLESVSENLFKFNPSVVSFSGCFSGCPNLHSIPEGIFSYCQNAQDFSLCFSHSGLESIPENIFKFNPNATNFSACFTETNLEFIPENLFKYNTAATSFRQTFTLCPYVESVPEGLFSSCALAEDFYACFSGTGLSEIPPLLFAGNAEALNMEYVFEECAAIEEVPSGLFDACTKVTSFRGTFTKCSGIQTIPAGLFSRNTAATDFSYCFNACSSLETIPVGIFATNALAENFEAVFQNAGVQAIPSTLFVTNAAATNFNWAFYGCSGVEEIPEGLFDNCTEALSFRAAFYSTGIDEIPSGLFDACTKATDFRYAFGITGISSIPSGLFSLNTAVQLFSGVFYNCQNLVSIPSDLFRLNTAVTEFDYAFEDCPALDGFTLNIGSSSVSTVKTFCTKKTGVQRTVNVPADSTSYSTFTASASTLGIAVGTL